MAFGGKKSDVVLAWTCILSPPNTVCFKGAGFGYIHAFVIKINRSASQLRRNVKRFRIHNVNMMVQTFLCDLKAILFIRYHVKRTQQTIFHLKMIFVINVFGSKFNHPEFSIRRPDIMSSIGVCLNQFT